MVECGWIEKGCGNAAPWTAKTFKRVHLIVGMGNQMEKMKEIDKMSFEALMAYLGVQPLPKKTFKPEFMRLSPAQIVRRARRHAALKFYH